MRGGPRAAVADGVGGYNYAGADPAGFAWALMDGIKAHLAKNPAADLVDVFQAAKDNASASPIRDGAFRSFLDRARARDREA